MAYVKTNWENLPSTDTPITETALDNMENGIEYNDQRLNGTKPMGSIVVDDVNCKNIYNPSYRANDGTIAGTGGNRTENNGVFSIAAVTTDAYFWGVIAQNNSYQDTAGELYEFKKDSYTISLSNSAFNNQYITYYNENKVSLGYTRFGNSTFTINKSDKTGAKYFTIRFGKINATSGTTYATTVQLEAGSEATSYTPYKNFNTTIKSVYLSGTTSANGNLSSGLNKNTTVVLCFHANNNNAIPTFYTNTASNEWTVHLNQVNGQILANTQASGTLFYIELYPSSSTSENRSINVVEEENR